MEGVWRLRRIPHVANMILTILNWTYVSLIILVLGIGATKLIQKSTGYVCKDWDMVLFAGIAFVTAYAEWFSLFDKVGAKANLILIMVCLVTAVICRKDLKNVYDNSRSFFQHLMRRHDKRVYIHVGIMCVFYILFLILALQRAYHADTDLYHAQSIRYIEEYGIVKGLGNLHHRLAFNSAFMCFQALFSWKFLIDQSMHVMNAYLCMLLMSYALLTSFWFQNRKIKGTDAFRLVILLYGVWNVSVISSPNTDNFVLMFIFYILCKWCEMSMREKEETEGYGILCLFALFAVTVKLSVAVIAFLVLKPAVEMLKTKNWRAILLFVCMGALIVIPFCARNVILSGYLIYPNASIDLFDFDWKMSPYAVNFDKQEIISRARGFYDTEQYSMANELPITEWMPVWWRTSGIWIRVMAVINTALIVPFCILNFKKVREHCPTYDPVINITVLVMLLYWLTTAPKSRYGFILMLGIPCMMFCLCGGGEKLAGILRYMGLLCLGILSLCFVVNVCNTVEIIPLKRPSYYIWRDCNEVQWEGISVYLGIENCYTGYYFIPATPYGGRLKYLELRGDGFKDGIRIKKEYLDDKIDTYGVVRN